MNFRKELNLGFPDTDNTFGNWKFNGNGISNNGIALTSSGVVASDYVAGVSEAGITAVVLDGVKYYYQSSSGSTFDSSSITVEALLKFINDDTFGSLQSFKLAARMGSAGWSITNAVGGFEVIVLDDSLNSETISITANINDGNWHHVVFCINRTTNKLDCFIDGEIATGSGADISSVTGSLNPITPQHLIVLQGLIGTVDELHITTFPYTLEYARKNYRGKLVEIPFTKQGMYLQYLPAIHHNNANLKEFLLPFETQYPWLVSEVQGITNLISWDEVPSKYAQGLASNFGFELMASHYLTDKELREFLKHMVWIYKRRGTISAIEKILDILGLTYTLTEYYSTFIPFTIGLSQIASQNLAVEEEYINEFEGSQAGLSVINDSAWMVSSGKLNGTGNGQNSDANGILVVNDYLKYFISVDFEIVFGFGSGAGEFGIYVMYTDSGNWVRLDIQTNASDESFIYIVKNDNGTKASVSLGEITNLVTINSGQHKLWAHVDHATKLFVVGVDDYTIHIGYTLVFNNFVGNNKGLFVNRNWSIDFDNFTIRSLDWQLLAKIPQVYTYNRKLKVKLTNYPSNYSAKFAYLMKVLPEYLTTDIAIDFEVPVMPITTNFVITGPQVTAG